MDDDLKKPLTYTQRRELENILNEVLRLERGPGSGAALKKDKRVFLRMDLSLHILMRYKAKTRRKTVAEYLRYLIRKDNLEDRLWLFETSEPEGDHDPDPKPKPKERKIPRKRKLK